MVVAALAVVQVAPFLLPVMMAHARRRSVEAELPFFLIVLSVFSRSSSPAIDEGLRRVSALGEGVFPELRKEAAMIERDVTYLHGAPGEVIESRLGVHPSRKLREFVHGFTITLSTGKSINEFVEEESTRQVSLLEAKWKGFAESVGSLAEVSLMVLALFPVGLDMIASAIPGAASSQILTISLVLLAGFSVALLFLMDSAQPVLHNSKPDVLPVLVTVAAWLLSTYLYLVGAIPIAGSILAALAVSVAGFLRTRGVYGAIRRGEEEVSQLLHALAEESKAGVSLPEALSKVSTGPQEFLSIQAPLAAFHRSILLGSSPEQAVRRISHPSWLVRLSFGMLAVAFSTGAGYEQLERLSSFFRRLSDARKNASRSLLPFFMIGVIVPVISVSSMSFLSSFNAGGVPFLPSFTQVSESYILVSISAVALLTGLLLSKLFTQTARHALAVPILLLSTLISLAVFGIV
jgi:archaellum biogenesis protein FlaJ (TadC family)